MRKLYTPSVCCILLCSSLLCGKDLIVGTASGYAPYVSINEEGTLEGFDIDVAKELAQKMGRTPVLQDLGSLPSLFLALEQGRVDCIIWGISITEERCKKMDMTYYHGDKTLSLPLVCWDKEPPEDPLQLEKIAVEAGSFQAQFAEKYPEEKVLQVPALMDALLAIKYAKAGGAIFDPSLIASLQVRFPQLRVREIPLMPSEQILGMGICSKGEITSQIQKALSQIEIKKLEEKWGLK